MKYGVVKDGKILYKYGFKEQHSSLPAGAVVLPLQEQTGKGKVTFVVQADKIVTQIEPNESKRLKLGKTMILEGMSDFVWEYLEKYWKENKAIRWEGSLEITEWDMTKKSLGNHAKRARRACLDSLRSMGQERASHGIHLQ